MSDFLDYDSDNTLEPPGSIAILGGGPVAIETALYARYLGFSVRLFSSEPLVSQLLEHPEATTPSLFATPLGLASLAAQRGLGMTMAELACPNYRAWVEQYFLPLLEVDFLKGTASNQVNLIQISLAQVENAPETATADEETEDDATEELPPDFVIEWTDGHDDACGDAIQSERFEAIIDVRASTLTIPAPPIPAPPTPAPHETHGTASWFPSEVKWLGPGSDAPTSPPDYYLLLNELPSGMLTDADMYAGFQRIQKLFACLCDRPKLDVYGNLGGFANS